MVKKPKNMKTQYPNWEKFVQLLINVKQQLDYKNGWVLAKLKFLKPPSSIWLYTVELLYKSTDWFEKQYDYQDHITESDISIEFLNDFMLFTEELTESCQKLQDAENEINQHRKYLLKFPEQ